MIELVPFLRRLLRRGDTAPPSPTDLFPPSAGYGGARLALGGDGSSLDGKGGDSTSTDAEATTGGAGVMAFDASLRLTSWNSSLEQLTGIVRDFAVGRRPDQVLDRDVARELTQLFERVLLGGEASSTCVEVRHRAGGRSASVRVVVSPQQDAGGRIVGGVAAVVDGADAQLVHGRARMHTAMLEQLPDAVSILDPEGRLTWANPAWERLTGWRLADAEENVPNSFLHGIDTDEASLEAVAQAERSGEPYLGELLRYRRDGSTFWMRLHRIPVLSEDGTLTAIVESGRDISPERDAARAVAQSRSFLASLIVSSVDGIFAIDRDLCVVEWNEALENWTNLSRALVLGDPLDDVLPVDDPATRRLQIAQVLGTGRASSSERQMHFPASGRSLRVEVVLSAIQHVETGETIGVLGQVRDVGVQHAAVDALRRERARLEEAIAVLDSGFAMFDEHETLIACNARYRHGKARRNEPAVGMSLTEVLALEAMEQGKFGGSDTRDAIGLARKLARHRGAGGAFEERIGQRTQRVDVARTRDGGSVVLETDITSLKETQASLELARDAANSASRAKSRFLANMSHELRTPLNSIIGFSRQVLRVAKLGKIGSRELIFLERVFSNGVHLLSLINGILDLSKVESGRVDVEIASTDIERVVMDSLAVVDGVPRSATVELRSEIPAGLAPVRTDGALLKQVLVNLLSNALKFTKAGHVALIVDANAESVPVAIRIEDTGIGIPVSRLEAIFEAFEQASAETAHEFGGTGLGLAISRSICLLMGATLEVESVEGKGSTFRIGLNGGNR